MSTKHTPGPWTVERRDWDGQFIYGEDERANGRRFIADVSMTYDGAEANARLISAAPDMLATLEWLDAIGGLGLHVHERISAAIKKARGEA